MWHPLASLDSSTLVWVLILCAAVAGALFFRLENLARPLRNSVAPLGIVSLAISLSPRESDGILQSWEEEGRSAARRHLSLDYLLIPFFSTALAVLGLLASRWFARSGHETFSQLAVILAWGQWGMALLDFVENTLLLRVLQVFPFVSQQLTNMAGGCARIKTAGVVLFVGAGFFSLLSFLS